MRWHRRVFVATAVPEAGIVTGAAGPERQGVRVQVLFIHIGGWGLVEGFRRRGAVSTTDCGLVKVSVRKSDGGGVVGSVPS